MEKIELARITIAARKEGNITLDDIKGQIIEEGIVSAERIEKKIVEGVEFLKIITPEGFNFIVTLEKTEYAGEGDVIMAPPGVEESIQRGEIIIEISDAEKWTNQSKYLTATTTLSNGYTMQYSLDLGATWEDYGGRIEVYNNGTVSICIRNAIGERSAVANYVIDKIDRDIPEITEITATATNIIFSAIDEGSGIYGYAITSDTEEPVEFTQRSEIDNLSVEVEKQNTTYYVWVKDKAGNVSAYSTIATTEQVVTKVEVTPSRATLKTGGIVELTASVQPANAFNKSITWSSSNTRVASVVGGVVTGGESGTAVISAISNYGENGEEVIGTCNIKVENPVTGITLSKTSVEVEVDLSITITANIVPQEADDKTITWTSSDASVATVAGGVITGVKAGTATITATSSNGKEATCSVIVKSPLLVSQIKAANYGDKVNYSANGITDWKVFYNDGTNVFIIMSNYLPYSKVPSGAGMTGDTGKTYATCWPSGASSMQSITNYSKFRPSISGVTKSYSLNSSYQNSNCVSALANTSNWTNFVNTTYGDYAIGGPTLEMFIASWNAKGYTKLYCNNTNDYGYYVGSTSSPIDVWIALPEDDDLYYPVKKLNMSDSNGYFYWFASPSAKGDEYLMGNGDGCLGTIQITDFRGSVRPVVQLKQKIRANKENGIWKLDNN